MDVIRCKVGVDHFFRCSVDTIARSGEGNSTRMEIELPQKLCDRTLYLDFKKPGGERVKTPPLSIDDNIATYNLPLWLLDEQGVLEVQLDAHSDSGRVWKSYVKKFNVRYSIGALDDIPDREDFVADVEKRLADLEDGKMNKFGEAYTNADNTYSAITIQGDLNVTGKRTIQAYTSGENPIIVNGVKVLPMTNDGTSTIFGVADPQGDTDATNKKYVDAAVAKAGGGSWRTICNATLKNGESEFFFQLGKGDLDLTEYDIAISMPFNSAVASADFYIKAIFTNGEKYADGTKNLLISKSTQAVSAYATEYLSCSVMLYDTFFRSAETIHKATNSAAQHSVAFRELERDKIEADPYLRVWLTNSTSFPVGSRIIVKGR